VLLTTAAAGLEFQPATPDDATELASFLECALQLPAGAPLLARPHMEWKYWSRRTDWDGGRSFVIRKEGAIAAHSAAWPVRIRVADRTIAAAHAVDWAADPKQPGAGTRVLRKIAQRTGTLIATGGTAITRRILPVLGFRPWGEILWFARPVRPLGQALTAAERNWRLPVRLLRNTLWRTLPPLRLPHGWSAAPLAPHHVPEDLWPQASAGVAVTVRDAALYQYFVNSPTARHLLFGLRKNGALVGYFCLAGAPHVARIADLWLPSACRDDWTAAFRTAVAVAASDADVYEVTAWATTVLAAGALASAGFRLRDRSPVSVLGDLSLPTGCALHLQMLDCDASFLAGESAAYLT